jgi:hypothetical protein
MPDHLPRSTINRNPGHAADRVDSSLDRIPGLGRIFIAQKRVLLVVLAQIQIINASSRELLGGSASFD